jgi:AcrR family transcriptional regulator
MNKVLEAREKSSSAREQIKLAARRLFAERGIDGATVREIVEASGQKNHGSLTYYFGTKEALVRELVADGAKLIDTRRNAHLDRLEAQGGPARIHEVVEALVYPSIGLGETEEEEDTYIRFVALLGMSHRDLFMEALENRWNSGYLRALDHLRRLMPDMPEAAKNQRMVFLGAFLNGVLSAREAALTDRSRPHPMWSSVSTLRHFIDMLSAMLDAPLDPALADAAANMSHDGGRPRAIIGSTGMIID